MELLWLVKRQGTLTALLLYLISVHLRDFKDTGGSLEHHLLTTNLVLPPQSR